jgi:ketosteroid isomerase-like protein
MPDTKADLVRRMYDEFNETLELPRWVLDDQVEWRPPADDPDNGVRRGVDAVTAYVRDWARTFDDYQCIVKDIVERGDDVVANVELCGRISGSAEPLTLPLTQVWTIHGGAVVHVREFRTTDQALAALAED